VCSYGVCVLCGCGLCVFGECVCVCVCVCGVCFGVVLVMCELCV